MPPATPAPPGQRAGGGTRLGWRLARVAAARAVNAAMPAFLNCVATDQSGLTATSTRTIMVEANPSTAGGDTVAGNTASSTEATSTAQ